MKACGSQESKNRFKIIDFFGIEDGTFPPTKGMDRVHVIHAVCVFYFSRLLF